jgi:hypothetical protein
MACSNAKLSTSSRYGGLRPLRWVAGCVVLVAAARTAAIDVDPGDWEAAPAGANVGLVYYQHANRSKFYQSGDRVLGNAQLSSDVAILRPVHWMEILGLTWAPQVLLPVGSLRANGDLAAMGDTSGIGDLILAMPVWFVNDAKQRRFLSVAPYVFAPIGTYDNTKSLNLGENRWKFDLQVGGEFGITDKVIVEAAADGMIFLDNTNFGPSGVTMSQAPLFQGQLYVSYLWTAATRVAIGLKGTTGGETTVSGVAQNNAVQTANAIMTASTFVDGTNQILFSVGRDLYVKNGLSEDFRFNLRYLHLF